MSAPDVTAVLARLEHAIAVAVGHRGKAEAARRLGTNRSTVHSWFNDRTLPRGDTWLLIPDALRDPHTGRPLSLDWLVSGKGSMWR